MKQSKVLLINPPLLHPFAPYIAMPLLAGTLKQAGWNVQSLDLNIESIDWLLSPPSLHILHERLLTRLQHSQGMERRAIERALTVFPATVEAIEKAKATLRSFTALANHQQFLQAHLILRNALWIISAAFPGLEFDLIDNQLYYDSESSQSILRAVHDPEKNIYRWVFEKLLVPTLADAQIGLICISVSATMQAIAAFTVAQLIREIRPDVHIVMCGNYPTRITARWQEPHPLCGLVDTFLTYECEEALTRLCTNYFHDHATPVPGTLRTQNGHLIRTPASAVNIETLPPPDFDDIPLEKYLTPGPVLPTYASRGCAWKCTFCSIPLPNVGFRLRSASTIVDEMEQLAQRYHTQYFSFVDEIMSIRSLREVSNELLRRNQKFFWFCETRFAHGFTSSLAEQLHRSGCRRLEFGLESFNQRILDLMNKETSIRDITQNISSCLRAGIPVHLLSMLGFPTETKEEALRTIQFIEDTICTSRDKYHLPYSTSGLGPFFLDSYSAIHTQPERFNIEIIPSPPEKDLALNLDYRVKSGINQEEGTQLLEHMAHHQLPTQLQDRLWFHISKKKDVREEYFLRACHNTGVPTALQRPAFLLPEQIMTMQLQFNPEVVIHESTCSLLGTDTREEQATIIVYQPQYDAILEFPSSLLPWLYRLKSPTPYHKCIEEYRQLTAASEEKAQKHLGLLLRSSFLTLPFPPKELDQFDIDQVIFFQEEGTQAAFDEEEGTGLLVSTIFGKTIEVNLEGFMIWALCEHGLTRKDQRLIELGLLQNSKEGAQHFLSKLCQLGFLYAEPYYQIAATRISTATSHSSGYVY